MRPGKAPPHTLTHIHTLIPSLCSKENSWKKSSITTACTVCSQTHTQNHTVIPRCCRYYVCITTNSATVIWKFKSLELSRIKTFDSSGHLHKRLPSGFMTIRQMLIHLCPNLYWATLFFVSTVASYWSAAGTFWGICLMV